jgi:hypothetical protein
MVADNEETGGNIPLDAAVGPGAQIGSR